ncbi:hypothetical protein BRADI_1g49113v3 [Brachypodium distachyon]|uniref:Uncharacterized protein n=1 Tax=Brachypodium distachyon TaxID=15368 RepID=A0A2K2DQF8_BRADI|nr:hypothetical protein BRADI_1g49113v3 [Brachypodium distachyon]
MLLGEGSTYLLTLSGQGPRGQGRVHVIHPYISIAPNLAVLPYPTHSMQRQHGEKQPRTYERLAWHYGSSSID